MTMLQVHKQAISTQQPIYHEFLLRYSNGCKVIYGFVEGKEDPCFYRGFIEHGLPDGWNIEMWTAGSRNNVLMLLGQFDWSRFSRQQILFFVDKDIVPFLGITDPTAQNLYITDKYSIENSIIDRMVCDRVLTELCGLALLKSGEKDAILGLFEQQYNNFKSHLSQIMAWIILWRRNGEKPCLNDILLHQIFKIEKGFLKTKTKPKGFKSVSHFIHSQCKILPYPKYTGVKNVLLEFNRMAGKDNYIRGKYLVWFFIQFVLSIHKNISSFSTTITKPPKMNVTLGLGNFAALVAPRARCPKSLRDFLDNTCFSYANTH
jgi:hypothetical protein